MEEIKNFFPENTLKIVRKQTKFIKNKFDLDSKKIKKLKTKFKDISIIKKDKKINFNLKKNKNYL